MLVILTPWIFFWAYLSGSNPASSRSLIWSEYNYTSHKKTLSYKDCLDSDLLSITFLSLKERGMLNTVIQFFWPTVLGTESGDCCRFMLIFLMWIALIIYLRSALVYKGSPQLSMAMYVTALLSNSNLCSPGCCC